jgi:hypothetical protein
MAVQANTADTTTTLRRMRMVENHLVGPDTVVSGAAVAARWTTAVRCGIRFGIGSWGR